MMKTTASHMRPTQAIVEQANKLVGLADRLAETVAITERAKQADLLESELGQMNDALEELREATRGLLCPTCSAPVVEQGWDTEPYEDENGREMDIEHEWATYACGLKLHNGEKMSPCVHPWDSNR